MILDPIVWSVHDPIVVSFVQHSRKVDSGMESWTKIHL